MIRNIKIDSVKEAFFTIIGWFILICSLRGFDLPQHAVYRIILISISCGLIVYINAIFLFPKLLIKRRYVLFVLLSIGIMIIIAILTNLVLESIYEHQHIIDTIPVGVGLVKWLFLAPMSIALTIASIYKLIGVSRIEREKKLEFELRFLKGQINPHFLFNSLNNLYSLSISKSDKAPQIVLELSNLLHYSLYDCDQESVPLSSEIKAIQNYCNLARIKDSSGMNIKFNYEDADGKLVIAPMIMITFVENAFKHSNIDDNENGWISIDLSTSDEGIRFHISNSVSAENYDYLGSNKSSGIGLSNIKRRLQIYYPDRHEIDIQQTDKEFHVKLLIW